MSSVHAQTKFMEKVCILSGVDACWLWTGADKGNGYGHTSRGPAHRRSYELFVGPIPDGLDICHRCDNRICVRPSHLFPGTRLENMQDCKRKGRTAKGLALGDRRGDKSSSAKLNWDAVREIRASDAPSKQIAIIYGITSDNVNRIRRNNTWKEV